jgi:hypothetical protein
MDINSKIFEVLYDGKISWTVNKEQLYTQDQKIATNAYCTRRSDNQDVLGIVGSRYMPMQNHQLVKEFIEATQEFNLTKVEGLCIDNGRKVIIRARIGDIQIGKDTVHRFITVSNTHDGTSQVKLGISNRVLVCSNGLMKEISSNELAKVKHTTNAGEKMNWYIRNIPKVLAEEEQMMRNYKKLSEVPVNAKHIQAVIESVYGVDSALPEEEVSTRKKNQVKEFDRIMTNNGFNVHGNTLWGLLQVQTYLASHTKTGTVTNDYMSGAAQEKSLLTYELLMEMIGNPIYEEA